MKKYIIHYCTLFLWFFLYQNSYSQYNWLSKHGGDGVDETMDVEKDYVTGNYFSAGYFSQNADFGSFNLLTSGSGDAFVACQNPHGDYIWVKKAGGSSSDRAICIAITTNSDILVSGTFKGSFQFDNQTITSTGNSEDIFVAKLNSQGNLLWLKKLGGTAPDLVYDMVADATGQIYLTGHFKGQTQYGNSTYTSANSTLGNGTQPSFDLMLVKMDPTGNVVWAKTGGGPFDDRGMALATDPSSNVYFTGQFSDTLQFGSFVFNNNAINAGYLMKLNPNGDVSWFYRLTGSMVLPYSLTQRQDMVYLTGDFLGTLGINTSPVNHVTGSFPNRVFALKISNSGSFQWGKSLSSENAISSRSVSVDTLDNVYISGNFGCNLTELSNLHGSGLFNSAGFKDIFTVKFNSQGIRQWEHQMGGPGDDFLRKIIADRPDRPVLAGSFEKFFSFPVIQSDYLLQTYNYLTYQTYSASCSAYNQNYLITKSEGQKDGFLSRAVNPNCSLYDYYLRYDCLTDSLSPEFYPMGDTIVNCDEIDLNIENRIENYLGPNFTYSWSLGSVMDTASVHSSQLVTVAYGPEDGCKTYSDTVYAQVESLQLSDFQSINGVIREATYGNCNWTCTKDCTIPATIYFPNLSPNINVEWTLPDGSTVMGDSIQVTVDGEYSYLATIGSGVCTQNGCINVFNWCQGTGGGNCSGSDILDLEIHLTDSVFNQTDTVYVCYNTNFGLELVLPSLGNTPLNLPLFVDWSFSNGNANYLNVHSTFGYHHLFARALGTGWTTVTAMVVNPVTGFGLAQIQRNIYIKIQPSPQGNLNISGPTNICPGNTIQLTASGGSNYQWDGDNIQTVIGNGAVAVINDEGDVTVGYTIADTILGCDTTLMQTVQIIVEPTPLINGVPDNLVVCPNDSVLLLSAAGTNVVWYGSTSDSLGTGNQLYVGTPGYYHYSFVNQNGCAMISETEEVKEFQTPYIDAETTVLSCNSTSITLTISTNSEYAVTWLSPLSGNSEMMQISSPGTYSCQINSCGITTTASVEITQTGTIQSSITYTGPSSVCPSDTVILQGPPGYSSYDWLPGHQTEVVGTFMGGNDYYLIVKDEGGCSDTAQLVIANLPGSPEPSIVSDSICQGETAQLSATGTGTLSWFGPDGGFISNGNTIQTQALQVDAVYFVSNQITTCPSTRVEVPVVVSPTALPPFVFGDTILCGGQALNLSTVFDNGITGIWSGPNGFSSSNDSIQISPFSPQWEGVYTITLNGNRCPGPPASVEVHSFAAPVAIISVVGDTVSCASASGWLYISGDWNAVSWSPAGETSDTIYPTQTDDYFAVVRDLNGCTDTSNAIHFDLFPNPAPPVVNDTTLCAGTDLSLSLNTTNQVFWLSSDTLSPPIAQGPDFTLSQPDSTQQFYVYWVDSNACSSSKVPFEMVVLNPDFQVEFIGDTSLCEGELIQLSVDSVSGISFDWTLPDGTMQAGNSVQGVYANPADTGYYVLHSFNSVCLDTRDSVYITIHPMPTAAIHWIGNDSICAGESSSLGSDSVWSSYLWLPGQETTAEINLNSGGVYQLIVSNEFGCLDTSSAETLQVFVPENNLQINDTTVCYGTPFNYVFSQPSITWFNSSLLPNTSGQIHLFPYQSDTIYYFQMVGSCVSDTLSFVMELSPEGVAPIISGSDTVCSLSTQTISIPAGNYSDIYWYQSVNGFTSPLPLSGTSITVQATYTQTTYMVQTYINGCHQPDGLFTVEALPLPDISSYVPIDYIVCEGSEFYLPLPNMYEYEFFSVSGIPMDSLYIDQCTSEDQGFITIVSHSDLCSDTMKMQLSVIPFYEVDLQFQSTLCEGGEISFNLSPYPSQNIAYISHGTEYFNTFPVVLDSLDSSHEGWYVVNYSAYGLCLFRTDSFNLQLNPNPIPEIEGSLTFCKGTSTQLSVSQDFDTFGWSSGSDSYQFEATDTGWVKVEVTENGCYGVDSVYLEQENCDFENISVFTPNGDGVNDLFDPIPEGGLDFLVEIYDRWGRKVYSFLGRENAFGGKNYLGQNLAEGTYYYACRYRDVNQVTREAKGFIVLVR